MGNQEFDLNEQHFHPKRRQKNRIYIRDNDLQIHVPTIKDANLSRRASQFRIPITTTPSYSEVTPVSSCRRSDSSREDLKLAMEEAKNSYDSMMQIREQLNQAYREFIQMNASKS